MLILNGYSNQSFWIWHLNICFKPEADLFVTNISTQFGKYAAFRPDPGAVYIDAFSIDWSDLKFYAFSPISVRPRVLWKLKQDSADGIIVAPFWPTQVWYLFMFKIMATALENHCLDYRKHQIRYIQLLQIVTWKQFLID